LTAQFGFADEVVDAQGGVRHEAHARQLLEVVGVRGDRIALEQTEGASGQDSDEQLSGIAFVDAPPEVALDGIWRGLVVPPQGDRRLGQPARQQSKVVSSKRPEPDLGAVHSVEAKGCASRPRAATISASRSRR
jgi:hypothetical protein